MAFLSKIVRDSGIFDFRDQSVYDYDGVDKDGLCAENNDPSMVPETLSSAYVVRTAIYVVKSNNRESHWSSQVSRFIARLSHSEQKAGIISARKC